MGKYNESIADNSVWVAATPTTAAVSLPFYATEAGHFYAESNYSVERESHDSYLFLYTPAGEGYVQSGGTSVQVNAGTAVVIDCHKYHRYGATGDNWEFFWLHIKGASAEVLFDVLYPNGIFAVNVMDSAALCEQLDEMIIKIQVDDIVNAVELSAGLHKIFNMLIKSSLITEGARQDGRYREYVNAAAECMRTRFAEPLTIDDILGGIPISKYHFIRVFKRMMGATPYSYLMSCRINAAKRYLRSTDYSVGEIAQLCGFADGSNFIAQFKKHTGQKPTQYRKYF